MKKRNALLLAALCAMAPESAARLQDADQLGGWTVTRLDLDVVPFPDTRTVGVEGTMQVRLDGEASHGPTLVINSRKRLFRFVDLVAPSGARVELDTDIPTLPQSVGACVSFEEPCATGTELELIFVCESEGESAQFEVREEIAFASWVEAWYPVPFDPERSLSSLLAAPGRTRLHLPEGWDAVTNGVRQAREATDGGVTVSFEVTQPVARSFAAGPYHSAFHEVDGRQIGVYLLSESSLDVERHARMLSAALAAQEERFGPYPYPSYAIAEVPESVRAFYASSEQGFIMARSSAFSWDHGNLPLWGHEMAHGWWGNLVGGDGPGGIVCNESLAQLSAVIAIETVEGEEAAREFLRFSRPGYSSQQCARGYFQLWRNGTDKPLSQLESGGWEHTLSDSKGHWMYVMLRRRVGAERFYAGLRGLIDEYGGKRMTLDDLRAYFIALVPEAELELFFEQWLDRTGAPILDVEWKPAEGGLDAVITQTQPGKPYHLELEVAVDGSAGTDRTNVTLRARQTHVHLTAVGEPSAVRLDPDHQLLIWKPEYGPRPSSK